MKRSVFLAVVLIIIAMALWAGISRFKKAVTAILPGQQPATSTGSSASSTSQTNKITYKNASDDVIKVTLPYPGAVVGKQFSVLGQARGGWYFEASFPVEVLDKNGKRLAAAPAQAQGEWMTGDFVPFKADLKVPESYIGPATLVLHKDNPSGLPQNDASISFPITIEY